ncbi:MAG: hypothetical protein GXP31_19530 [Kiritimatiellaeota bacterium]|nr:hypothetical protein [Kiritimatiellota bacterium]
MKSSNSPVWRTCISLASLAALAAYAPSVLRADVTVDGIGVFPLSEQTWRSRVMIYPEKVTDQDRVWSGPDFFTFEYGEPCAFRNRDFVKDYGYHGGGDYRIEDGKMVFTVGAKAFHFGFGGTHGDLERPSNRFGVCWGPNLKDRYRLRMVLEQDRPTTWYFGLESERKGGLRRSRKTFQVPGKGRRVFETDLGFVRNLWPRKRNIGIRFDCATPGATVRLESIKIAPSSANLYFRKGFEISEAPVLAHATFQVTPVYDLYVNGRKVDAGTRFYATSTALQKTVDLRPYLRQGRNVIAFRSEFFNWLGPSSANWRFEGVAVDRQGKVTRILGDADWKCSLSAAPDWMAPEYDDSNWKKPRLLPYSNRLDRVKTLVSSGMNPRHMGLLDVSVMNQRYPVFEDGSPPLFRVRLPAGVKGKCAPLVEVFRAGTDERVEVARGTQTGEDADFVAYRVTLSTREVGPYRLIWKLVDENGEVVETRREEMVIVGPIPQERVPLATFEEELGERLELVRRIDCAKPLSDPKSFIDHSGMYQRPAINKSRVVRTNGLAYRETGGDAFDYFGYALRLEQRGEPYLVEVTVPDDQDRYIYSCVVELHPVRYRNNSPRKAVISATGSSLTGGRFPLTHGTRKIRYIYFPGSETAAVMVMNGRRDSRAAACAINIYRVRGGLPALDVPDTQRLLGTHNERLSVMARTLSCENPVENDRILQLNEHRDGWYHWYRMFERKIRLLRFQGRNMTVEGLFMYTRAEYPSLRNSPGAASQDFDPAYLGFKMYEYNRIHCLVGFEYMCNQAMLVANVDTVSDRRMWQGEPSLQHVDRYGRQLACMYNAGVNFLHPTVEKYFMDVVREIRDRYSGCKAVVGMEMVVSNWYAPGFGMRGFLDLLPIEIGYSDYTVGLFERETGIRLSVAGSGPERFAQRYSLLTGKHKATWLAWRAAKLRQFVQRMSNTLRSGENPWQLYIYPTFKHQQIDQMPWLDSPAANREACVSGLESFLRQSGFPLELYENDPNIRLVAPLVTVGFKSRTAAEHLLDHYAWDTNPGTLAGVQKLGSFFINTALDEVDCPATKAPAWPWRGTSRGVFVARGAGENAMTDFVNVLASTTPQLIITQWMDCNMETGAGAQLRRLAREFYVTPQADFSPLPAGRAHGVTAQTAPRETGGIFLRLVNNSPYASTGTIKAAGAVRDLVYETLLPAVAGRTHRLTLLPNDIRTFALPGARREGLQCRFSFAPEIAEKLFNRAATVLDRATLPPHKARQLLEARASQDAFAVYSLLVDYEVLDRTRTALKQPVPWP